MEGRRGSPRRAVSAGYRFPDPSSRSTVSLRRQSATEARAPERRDPDLGDPVKQDQSWREMVRAEKEAVRQWQKNWGFLADFDQLGRPRQEAPLPRDVSVFSDRVPNTASRVLGSRVGTELGLALARLDNLLLLNCAHRKLKPDPEMQPC
ncbi:hypothetical protein GN956_G18599 [Arapaima gigas]